MNRRPEICCALPPSRRCRCANAEGQIVLRLGESGLGGRAEEVLGLVRYYLYAEGGSLDQVGRG